MIRMMAVMLIISTCPDCQSWRHWRVIFSDGSAVTVCHKCGKMEKAVTKSAPPKILTL
jgi:ribosomal protein S27E